MSEGKDHIGPITPEQMSKYLKGELSNEEMHRIEKLMLDSDFEAEAMEGFEASGVNLEEDLHVLNGKLEERIRSEKKVFPLWFKIAASMSILAISIVLVLNWTPPSEEKQLTQSESKKMDKEQLAERDVVEELENEQKTLLKDTLIAMHEVEDQDNEPGNLSTLQAPPPTTGTEATEGAEHDLAKEENFAAEEEAVDKIAHISSSVETIADPEVPEEADLAFDDAAETILEQTDKAAKPVSRSQEQDRGRNRSVTKRKKTAKDTYANLPVSRVVQGKVVSENDGQALPGVNVVLKGTSNGTVTDEKGNYSLTIPDNDEAELQFSYIGYESTEANVPDTETLNIAMNTQVAELSEVVVTGVSNGDAIESPVRTAARPVDGRNSYRKYLEENVRIPADSLEGRVIVEFDVLPNGSPANFTIKKGIGTAYDQEAIRLIRNGPAWIPAKENDLPVSSKVRVRVRFK